LGLLSHENIGAGVGSGDDERQDGDGGVEFVPSAGLAMVTIVHVSGRQNGGHDTNGDLKNDRKGE